MNLLYVLAVTIAAASVLFAEAGKDATIGVTPVYLQGGGSVQTIVVAPSTNSLVLLSTPTSGVPSLRQANPWREVWITNRSSHAALALYFSDNYAVYSTTAAAVILSSGSPSNHSDSYTLKTGYQGSIWGIWDSDGYKGKAGAVINRHYAR